MMFKVTGSVLLVLVLLAPALANEPQLRCDLCEQQTCSLTLSDMLVRDGLKKCHEDLKKNKAETYTQIQQTIKPERLI